MEVNQVNLNGEELINLTNDTVSEETLLYGATAHDASGNQITGSYIPYSPNLLDNPDFLINQTGIYNTIYNQGDYICDRWQYVSGTIKVNSDLSIVLDGTIAQILEEDIGDDFLAYASAGTASYDPSTRTYTITASGDTIKWAMLINGKVQVPFNKSDPATNLMRCQRHNLVIKGVTRYGSDTAVGSNIDFLIPIPTSMRTLPSLVASSLKVKTTANVEVEGFTFAIVAHRANYVNVRATKTAHGMTAALLEIPSGAYMKFDANL